MQPRIGTDESEILDQVEVEFGLNIKRQFKLDGYCQEQNLVIEVYEKHHCSKKFLKRDERRINYIQEKLNCNFLFIYT